MRSLFSFIILATLVPSAAHAQRQLVKASQEYDIVWATDPYTDTVTADCETITFAPASRSIMPSPTEGPHTDEPYRLPACRWRGGFVGDQRTQYGIIQTHSIRDVGVYTLRCYPIFTSQHSTYYWDSTTPDGCGQTRHYSPTNVQLWEAMEFTFEIYNNAPSVNVSRSGSGLLSGNNVAHDASLILNASGSDSDPGTVRLSWRIASQPAGSAAIVGSLSGAMLNVQFIDERDFGIWQFEAIADDAQGERVISPYTVQVVNQTPVPEVAGGPRVRVGTPIELSVSPDEDGGEYAAIVWEAIAPGDTAWTIVGNTTEISLPTSRADIGFWTFRVTVTDNESPALSGTSAEFELEVYNEPPVISAMPPMSPVRAGVGSIALNATANDPDGGSVTVTWRAIQAPRSAGVDVGVPLSSTTITSKKGSAPFSMATSAAHAGTWVFIATAQDEEGGSAESSRLIVVVDEPPIAAIRNAPSTVVGPGRFDLNDESRDPDSYCADPADPNRCHLLEAGQSFTPLSPGIRRRRWFVESVPSEFRHYYPVGPANAAFHVPDALPVLHFEPGQIAAGTYRFRLDVEDGEINTRSAWITIEVLPPPTPPFANVGMPQRYLADSGRRLLEDVWVDGSWSFDLDTARSFSPGPGEGITAWSWAALPPSGCGLYPGLTATPRARLFAAGTVLPLACFGVWRVRLTVQDDDIPAQYGFNDAIVVLGTCGGSGVCIDSPIPSAPFEVNTGTPVDVPIIYYVDAAVYARPEYRYGFYGFIDILPIGSSTPIKTLTDTTVSSRPGQLTTVRWRGDTNSGGIAPTGTYDVRVRIADINLVPGPETRQNSVILFENAVVTIDASRSIRFARHQDIDAGTATADFFYRVTGSFGIDQVRSTITRVGGGLAYEVTSDTDDLSGEIHWNGRNTSGVVLAPGDYDLVVSVYEDGRLLNRSAAYRFTIYRLGLGPLPPAPSILSVALNLDDDNNNGVIDVGEMGVTGENDLTYLTLRVEPPTLAGVMTLSLVGGGTPIALFTTSSKAALHGLPLTRNRPSQAIPGIHIEGRTIGVHQLDLLFTPTGRPALRNERLRVSVMGLETVADTDGTLGYHPTDSLAPAVIPGLWQTGHSTPVGPDQTFNVLMDPTDNFVDNDPAHFWIRVHDFAANRDPAAIETVAVQIGTLAQYPVPAGASEIFIDYPHEVQAIETGIDTGVFVTQSQLITSNDEDHVEEDDQHFTPGISGALDFDDNPGDRTHRIGSRLHGFLAGGVRASYLSGGRLLQSHTPVCGRAPDVRRSISIRTSAMREPYQDGGYSDSSGTFQPGITGQFDFQNLNTTTDIGGVAVHDPEEPSEPYMDISTGSNMYLPGGPVTMMRDGRGAAVNPLSINDQLHRANGAWAPACIEMRREPGLHLFDAPLDAMGVDVLEDGIIERNDGAGINEFEDIFTAVDTMPGFGPVTQTRLDFVYGAHNIVVTYPDRVQGAYGVTLTPRRYPSHFGKVMIIMNGFVQNNIRVLAHELGHALANLPDSDNDPWNFFPANTTYTDDTYYFRRFLPVIGQAVHIDRPVLDGDAIGNTHRHPY